MPYIISSALLIMIASLSGKLFASKRYGPWTEKNLKYLIAFSIGVFAVIVFGLLSEAFAEFDPLLIIVAAVGGAVILELASLVIPKAHHHHGTTDHAHSRIDARRMLMGDAIHNMGDGLVLVPAFAISIEAGIVTAVGIFIHEFVQEISEFFVLKEAGFSNKRAFALNFLVSSTILVGVALSLFLSSIESAEGLLLAFAAGGFIHILVRDLIPHTLSSMKRSGTRSAYGAALVAGLLIMGIVTFVAPHSHGGEEGHDDLPADTLVAQAG